MWTREFPTSIGRYWFLGYRFKSQVRALKKPDLYLIDVFMGGSGLIYICGNAFMYQAEGATGYWKLADLPELPCMPFEFLRELEIKAGISGQLIQH